MTPQQLAQAQSSAPRLHTLWARQLEFDVKRNRFKLIEHPYLKMLREKYGDSGCWGAYFTNSGARGFDAKLGQAILKAPEKALDELIALAKAQGWKVLQVDLESMPELAAEEYEKFLDRLLARAKPAGIGISIALHAKVSESGGYEGSRFQRWKSLAAKDLDFVIMAYDHHWETSAPGPVAPLEWVKNVTRFAQSHFPKDRMVIGLPQYGYHWKKNAKTGAWKGSPKLTSELAAVTQAKGWKAAEKGELPSSDGRMFRKGKRDVIAFDDSEALRIKVEALQSAPLAVQRIAIWRLGNPIPTELTFERSSQPKR